MIYTRGGADDAAHREAIPEWPESGSSLACRFPVYVRQDPATGDVILSRRPDSWEGFFKLTEQVGVPGDFMSDRRDGAPQKRKLFR